MAPTADEVIELALATLRDEVPGIAVTRSELALTIALAGGRSIVWNLHDFARLAVGNAAWRDELVALVGQVVERVASSHASTRIEGVGLRLRPDARVPAELRTGEYAAEPVLDGVWALYGERTKDGIAIRPWTMLLANGGSRDELRERAAAATLGQSFHYRDMMSPMGEGIPIYTNAEFHPHVAAALLMPAAWWRGLQASFKQPPPTLIAMIPSPSRIFLTPIDVPEVVNALRSLGPNYEQTEEELLSTHVYRFDGTRWKTVGAHDA